MEKRSSEDWWKTQEEQKLCCFHKCAHEILRCLLLSWDLSKRTGFHSYCIVYKGNAIFFPRMHVLMCVCVWMCLVVLFENWFEVTGPAALGHSINRFQQHFFFFVIMFPAVKSIIRWKRMINETQADWKNIAFLSPNSKRMSTKWNMEHKAENKFIKKTYCSIHEYTSVKFYDAHVVFITGNELPLTFAAANTIDIINLFTIIIKHAPRLQFFLIHNYFVVLI